MAFDQNSVTLVGGLTRDPELRATGNGTSVVQLGIAVNHGKKDKDGNWNDEANFADVTAFGDLADNVAESLGKGDRVIVVGRFAWRQWEEKETGAKRSKIEFIANSIGPDLSRATVEVSKNERRDG